MLNSVEKWLAAVLIALCLFQVGRVAAAMATTSLSTDEFGTVGTFSSKGPGRVLTDYRAPKNHIFFNLLNSALPGRESWNPARVRMLSIAATVLTAAAIAGYAIRRGRWLEGAAVLTLWAFGPEMLTLSMEARGYGFLGLFAVVMTIAVLEYAQTGHRAWLAALVLAGVFGTYTVPSFLLLAGPMLLLLWLVRRDRETFVAGALTAGLILLLYAPLLGQIFAAFRDFHEGREEAEFGTIASVSRAVRLYLLPVTDGAAGVFLGLALAAPFALWRWRPGPERIGPAVVAAACVIYLGTLLLMRTPPLRLAACGVLPAAFVGIWAVGAALRTALPARDWAAAVLVIGGGLLFAEIRSLRAFEFLPTENWTLAARAIDAGFPPSVKIDFARYAKYLKQTLPDARARGAAFDAGEFAAGRLVVADAGNKWAEGRQFTAPAGLSGVAEWRIPGRIRDIVLTYRPPVPPEPASGVPGVGTRLNPAGASFEISGGPHARTLVVLWNRGLRERELAVDAPGAFVAGNALVVPLESRPTRFTLRPAGSDLTVTAAWISP